MLTALKRQRGRLWRLFRALMYLYALWFITINVLYKGKDIDLSDSIVDEVITVGVETTMKDIYVDKNATDIVQNKPDLVHNRTVNKVDVNVNQKVGEMGKAVKITKPDNDTKNKIAQGWKKHEFNLYVSDMIAVNRSIEDCRDKRCSSPNQYLPDLPPTSVIICFHNEAWSTLIRTLHSVIDRTPDHLLEEIIFVDDKSTEEYLKDDLVDYVQKYNKVKLIRSSERVGLIRARLLGAETATATVLTFLDSHCECMEGWLEPMLHRIARNSTTVVCPVIDTIDADSFEYKFLKNFQVGGFNWKLQFTWSWFPKYEQRAKSVEPVPTPTMAGGLFSINKSFFYKLGAYDPGFDIWGGENLELSFKTWMCGGRLEILPCSHVGHIFRKKSPYKWRTGVNVLQLNSMRLAEVWLDDYKQYYYDRVGHNLGSYGDISARKKLRSDLQCRSFKWYLDHVYPELFIPKDAVASGQIRNLPTKYCLKSRGKDHNVTASPCHNNDKKQSWMLSPRGEIRADENCLDYLVKGGSIILRKCHGSSGNQAFIREQEAIIHRDSKKCLTLSIANKLSMDKCQAKNVRQQWRFGSYNQSKQENKDNRTTVFNKI